MKKILVALCIAAIAVGSVSAVDMSAGGYAGLGLSNTTYKFDSDSIKESGNYLKVGAFFDATYFVADVGAAVFLSGKYDGEKIEDTSLTYLTVSGLGKYPINLGSFVLSPVVGIEYDIPVVAKYDGEDIEDMENNLWVKGGAVADIDLGSMYLRPGVTVGYRFLTKDEKDTIKDADDAGFDISINNIKVDITVGLGFKL